MLHHIHWEYVFSSEFFHTEVQEDEYFDSFEAAKARVQELLFKNDYKFTLDITWYDGDDTGVPYRHFSVTGPDRG